MGRHEDDFPALLAALKQNDLRKTKYEWYLDLRRYGKVPHGGFGLGGERTVAWICGLKHIRVTIPYAWMMGRTYPQGWAAPASRAAAWRDVQRCGTTMRLDRGQIEVVDDQMAAVLRQKTGAERLQIANGLFVSMRRILISLLGHDHPDWNEQRLQREVSRRISRGSV